MYLGLRTDSNTTEIKLVEKGGKLTVDESWESGRELSDHILTKLEEILKEGGVDWDSIDGLIVFKGPGSFTGLRIGATVMNSFAYAKNLSIVGEAGDNWLEAGIKRLNHGETDTQVVPEYGAAPNITKPGKRA